ncbi:MAG: hypothetical protein BMS9Abin17_0355 [Acidimicrobiia bacterium]|nr:MAG: hypothetical protein BMS9Abin17_0355 [Acidimicrobiia bacterium]
MQRRYRCGMLNNVTAAVEGIRSSGLRDGIAESASSLFSHADYPLSRSLDYRDDGVFGPRSITWRVIGDASAFIGGIRSLLIQAAHPEVAAGVLDHSIYETDPLGRLSRTSAYVTATTYGADAEVQEALARVRLAHIPVEGTSHRGREYSAGNSAYAAWVHNTLADSFLAAYEAFGPHPLTSSDADAYVAEQARLGDLVHASDLPATRADLSRWISLHPDLGPSPGMSQALAFLKDPPLPRTVIAAYKVLFYAAVATVPTRIAGMLGLTRYRVSLSSGRAMTSALRWALGASPSWWLALERTGQPLPSDVRFRRPPPIPGIDSRFFESVGH